MPFVLEEGVGCRVSAVREQPLLCKLNLNYLTVSRFTRCLSYFVLRTSYFVLIRNFPVPAKAGDQVDHGHQVTSLADGAIKITTKCKGDFPVTAQVVFRIHN